MDGWMGEGRNNKPESCFSVCRRGVAVAIQWDFVFIFRNAANQHEVQRSICDVDYLLFVSIWKSDSKSERLPRQSLPPEPFVPHAVSAANVTTFFHEKKKKTEVMSKIDKYRTRGFCRFFIYSR